MTGILAAENFWARTGLTEGWPLNSMTALTPCWTKMSAFFTAVGPSLLLLSSTYSQPRCSARARATSPWYFIHSQQVLPPTAMPTFNLLAAAAPAAAATVGAGAAATVGAAAVVGFASAAAAVVG